jgi:hypothetical protein
MKGSRSHWYGSLRRSSVPNRMRAHRTLGLVLWLLGSSFSARAQDDAVPDAYPQVVQRAISEFDAGHWDEARALFRRAHELSPNARTWRGLAITAFELRRYVDAVRELEAALQDTRKPLTEQQRQELSELLLRARAFVSTYRLSVRPADAQVSIDGAPSRAGESELLLDPGLHTLVFTAPGYDEQQLELRAEAGKSQELSVELRPPPQVAAPETALTARPAQAALPSSPQREPDLMRDYVATLSLTGAAVLAGASAVTLGALAQSHSSRYRSCDGPDPECSDILDRGQRLELATNVMIGVAGASAVAALITYFIERRAERARAVRVAFGADPAARRFQLHAVLAF